MIAPKLSQKMIDEECDKWVKTQTKLTIGEAFKAGAKFSKQEEREAIGQDLQEARQEAETWRLMCCGLLSEIEGLKFRIEGLEK